MTGTGGRLTYVWHSKVTEKCMSRVGGALKAELTSAPSPYRALELSGFNWNEFLPTIWELIPYSFLIDYGTNIANVVCGWFTDTSGLGWCYRGTEQKVTEVISASPIRPAYHNPPDVTWLGTSGSWESAKSERLVYTRSVPIFGLNDATMSFQVSDPSVRQWFNTIILALQRAGRRPGSGL